MGTPNIFVLSHLSNLTAKLNEPVNDKFDFYLEKTRLMGTEKIRDKTAKLKTLQKQRCWIFLIFSPTIP